MLDGYLPCGVEAEVNTETVRVPVLRVQTETNFTEGSNAADADGEFYRRWDVAGTSHADSSRTSADSRSSRGTAPEPPRCRRSTAFRSRRRGSGWHRAGASALR